MLASYFVFVLSWVIAFGFVAAGLVPLNHNLQIRNAPGISSFDTWSTLRRALSAGSLEKTVVKNSTILDASWINTVLFSNKGEVSVDRTTVSAGMEIVCTSCYIKGIATAQFTIEGDFNFTQAFLNVSTDIKNDVDTITERAADYIEAYFNNITSDGIGMDDLDFDLPPVPPTNVDFDINIPEIPECRLEFQFDGMELYMEVDTVLSGGATYTINLYTSTSPIGLSVNEDIWLGVIFAVDLILSVETEIDISSGFHIQLNDGVAIGIALFNQSVSNINFNGGRFEFLPVQVQSAGVALTASLRVGIKTGVELTTDFDLSIAALENTFLKSLDFSAGVEAGVWADVAQFKTNVTVAPADSICELHVVEEYAMLLGAGAGATVALGWHKWGPEPTTQISIWYTTMAEVCAATKSAAAIESAASTAARITARDDLTTRTTTTTVTYTATACESQLLNCPISLQSTSKYTVISTLTTAVPSGSEATFPATAQNSVVSTKAFGESAQKMISTLTGSPTLYTPPPSTTSAPPSGSGSIVDEITGGKTGGVSNKTIIGVSVGIGAAVLISIIAGGIYCCRRKRYAPVLRTEPTYVGPQIEFLQAPKPYSPVKHTVEVTVVESQLR